jgi:hypothetical protein
MVKPYLTGFFYLFVIGWWYVIGGLFQVALCHHGSPRSTLVVAAVCMLIPGIVGLALFHFNRFEACVLVGCSMLIPLAGLAVTPMLKHRLADQMQMSDRVVSYTLSNFRWLDRNGDSVIHEDELSEVLRTVELSDSTYNLLDHVRYNADRIGHPVPGSFNLQSRKSKYAISREDLLTYKSRVLRNYARWHPD